MKKFAWGVVGTGAIAGNFCKDIASSTTMTIAAICSRTKTSAESFASQFNKVKIYDDFAAMLQDPQIDAVYIATPNHTHVVYTLQAIAAGKPVLTEKPLALNPADIEQIIQANARHQTFAMEAMWSRFLPAIAAVKKKIHAGQIGEIRQIRADLSYFREENEQSRFFNRELGGGAAFDLGVYPLSLTIYLFGMPDQTRGKWVAAQSGCDMRNRFILSYQGAEAQLSCGFDRDGDNRFLICGSKGAIEIDAPFLKAQRLVIYSGWGQKFWLNCRLNRSSFFRKFLNRINLPGRRVERYAFAGNGLQFQAEAVMQAVNMKQNQSQVMPLEESHAVAAIMESVLAQSDVPDVKAV